MATLVFSGIGTALGGPIGGAIGSLIGRQVDSTLFGTGNRQGARLAELSVTTSSYGQRLPRHFGRMRTAGSVIWAMDLVEHSETQGTGKSTPSITTYSYTANFAVALSSRPILGIGRIWADGKLLRGADGTLKVAGTLRIHTGHGDQTPDPLLAAAEGANRCPAYRGCAYAVFEALDLSAYYNRIPSLTFEIIADETFDLESILGEGVDAIDAAVPLAGITGYTSDGTPADDLQTFDQIIPLEIDARGPDIVIARQRFQDAALLLPEPAVATGDGDFGAASGFSRQRAPVSAQHPSALRYYDTNRDYQASVQRAAVRPGPGEPATLELPAALDAATARALIETTARRVDWSRDRISWRTTELDTAVGPGSLVALPGIAGTWRVREWEWLESGVELALQRALPTGADALPLLGSDAGRVNPPVDADAGETRIVAFELPFDAASGLPDAARTFAAVSSPSAQWQGAALYGDRGEGQLVSLGASGRRRAIVGTAISILPAASPLVFDRESQLRVTLLDPAMMLVDADVRQVSAGANCLLVGEEIVQFLRATHLDGANWRLEGLLRGRGGTEHAVANHGPNEPVVFLDTALTALDSAILGSDPARHVLAIGRVDPTPSVSFVHQSGLTLRPLSPVRPRKMVASDGSWILSWTRRARGGWAWADGIDVPLVEQAESYLVTAGPLDAPLATWTVPSPTLQLAPALRESLARASPGAALEVRQLGTSAVSLPLTLCILS
ncbi:GTA baseplate fiber-binding domain-containing protein [Novosphingobium sp. Leaf2]|uniref:GTA baseplate fiber-binding domain-containing protein n=1 Tax=Novosphingobium sp. Leaf2 TaxID=1735670 RepID=UPI000701707E|nr:phage tail protein [Novosphingobium sp. Leaf2]KQM20255.1 hypothetical protein ASE49_17220 [Novosphingobium sp. Leaf2]